MLGDLHKSLPLRDQTENVFKVGVFGGWGGLIPGAGEASWLFRNKANVGERIPPRRLQKLQTLPFDKSLEAYPLAFFTYFA